MHHGKCFTSSSLFALFVTSFTDSVIINTTAGTFIGLFDLKQDETFSF